MRYFKRRLICVLAAVIFLTAAVLGISKWKKQESILEIHSYHDVIKDLNSEEGEKYKKREPGLYQPGPLKYEGNGKYVPKNIKFTSWAELEKQGILTIEDGELSTPIDDNEGNYLVERYISGALILPDNITTIAEDTFSFCSLKEVIIPEGVEKISSRAFKGCAKLSCISIPESLQIIGESAFSGCEGMENLKIPESAETIEYNAFFNVPHVEYQGTAVYAKEDIFWGAESMNGRTRSDIMQRWNPADPCPDQADQ
ncbi:MAG: leucine-rich repeat domain-containing protein [Eubacterium sp.]|nr:leucine-rich repeat domain-containing protein [Eubacterium sp.]